MIAVKNGVTYILGGTILFWWEGAGRQLRLAPVATCQAMTMTMTMTMTTFDDADDNEDVDWRDHCNFSLSNAAISIKLI